MKRIKILSFLGKINDNNDKMFLEKEPKEHHKDHQRRLKGAKARKKRKSKSN